MSSISLIDHLLEEIAAEEAYLQRNDDQGEKNDPSCPPSPPASPSSDSRPDLPVVLVDEIEATPATAVRAVRAPPETAEVKPPTPSDAVGLPTLGGLPARKKGTVSRPLPSPAPAPYKKSAAKPAYLKPAPMETKTAVSSSSATSPRRAVSPTSSAASPHRAVSPTGKGNQENGTASNALPKEAVAPAPTSPRTEPAPEVHVDVAISVTSSGNDDSPPSPSSEEPQPISRPIILSASANSFFAQLPPLPQLPLPALPESVQSANGNNEENPPLPVVVIDDETENATPAPPPAATTWKRYRRSADFDDANGSAELKDGGGGATKDRREKMDQRKSVNYSSNEQHSGYGWNEAGKIRALHNQLQKLQNEKNSYREKIGLDFPEKYKRYTCFEEVKKKNIDLNYPPKGQSVTGFLLDERLRLTHENFILNSVLMMAEDNKLIRTQITGLEKQVETLFVEVKELEAKKSALEKEKMTAKQRSQIKSVVA